MDSRLQCFVQLCARERRPCLPAIDATMLLCMASLPDKGGTKAGSLQHCSLAINNCHEDLGWLSQSAEGKSSDPSCEGELRLLQAYDYVVFTFVTFGPVDTGTGMLRVNASSMADALWVVLLQKKGRRHQLLKQRPPIPWKRSAAA
ncbi:hypothetical protein CYMTET_26962 [Cymbomonas tetramitiformis]|uniref:Uncharacterized protein n=1 Tax=Cymbomonas tetramitiformis TaxID=36881 RepID=A0AAE0KXQ5_9CHLO|nr:hypothetical protein CYMTET_26962 [Cymbomonas tetramitiformis]